MPEDREIRRVSGKKMRKWRDRALIFSTFTYRAPQVRGASGIKDMIKAVFSILCAPVLRSKKIINPYLVKMEDFTRKQEKTNKIGDYWFYDPEKDLHCFDAEDLNSLVPHRFEMIEIPIPIGYDSILTSSFGDWRTPVMAANDHGDFMFDCHTPYKKFLRQNR